MLYNSTHWKVTRACTVYILPNSYVQTVAKWPSVVYTRRDLCDKTRHDASTNQPRAC